LVSVSDEKQGHVLQKLDWILDLVNTTFLRQDITSIHGSLQYLSFIYRDGWHTITSLSSFLSHFHNDFMRYHLPSTAWSQLSWWLNVLSHPNISWSLTPSCLLTSTSGSMLQCLWVSASSLALPGLLGNSSLGGSQGHDIGWAE